MLDFLSTSDSHHLSLYKSLDKMYLFKSHYKLSLYRRYLLNISFKAFCVIEVRNFYKNVETNFSKKYQTRNFTVDNILTQLEESLKRVVSS